MNLRKTFKLLNNSTLLVILISLLLAVLLISNNSKQKPGTYKLAVLPTTLDYINNHYADETKVDPNQMIIDGLNKLESVVTEVLVDFPDPKSSANFTVQVNKKTKSYRNLKVPSWSNVQKVMQDVFSFVVPNLKSSRITPVEIERAVTDKMLKTLDQHSGIIPPRVYNEFKIETEGSFGGLGIVIAVRDGQLTVVSPLEGTPAYRAGIKSNDKIVQIENESTINMSLMEAVSKLRGKKGTKVIIYIMRDTFTKEKEYIITRDTIKIESVEDFRLGNDTLYLRIRDFQQNTVKSLEEIISRSRNNIKGIILDLRGNPGGLLDQAEKVSNLFLSYGTIVITKDSRSERIYHARPHGTSFNGKVVVLVDSGSASASEIVAGALKNNQRAVIIGEKTFGKGSVQQIFDLDGGAALKLTVGNYLTPGSISIQDVGITPDIEIVPVIITEESIIYNGFEESEQTETNSVHRIKYLHTAPTSEQDEQTPEEALTKNKKREKLNEDFSVRLAREIIESVKAVSREETLKKSSVIIADFISKEEKKIERRWKELKVNWSSGKGPLTDPDVAFQIYPLNPELFAGEKRGITLSAVNNGNSSIYRLRAVTTSDNPVFNGKELVFGKLRPGQSKNQEVIFDVPQWTDTRNDEVKIKFFHSNDVEILEGSNFDINTIAKDKPLFAYNFEIVDDGRHGSFGNADGELDKGELVSLLFNIKNTGSSISPKTTVTIKNLSGDALYLQKGRLELTDLQPGKSQTVPFLFRVNKKENINLELNIIDEVFRQVITSRIDIAVSDNVTEFIESGGFVTIVNETPVRGGNNTLPVIAYAGKGSVFALLGYKGDYAKIKLPTFERAGWVLRKDVEINREAEKENTSPDLNEIFVYSQPDINIASTPLVTNEEYIKISGFVVDNDTIESISIFKGDDKIKLLIPDKRSQEFSFSSSLEDGLNVFSVVVKDSAGLFSKETVTVRKSGPLQL